ncbi:MAG: penicillin acylase family protein [Gemmatimonadota bacterium]
MAARHVLLGVSAAALAATLYASACGIGPVPPLGRLLDPANGAWAAVGAADLPSRATADMPALGNDVEVRYDDRGVPHIFAQSEMDAYRALGYVVARDRLFQLDLQTRAASGRLSEMVGGVARFADEETRQLGMPRAALAKWRSMAVDDMGRRILDAYADGVNAYMETMSERSWPVEYRILDARPERWEPVNSLHLFMRMSNILTYIPSEFDRIAARAKVGRAAAEAIFPLNSLVQEPIQPNEATPWFDTSAIAPPGTPDTSALVRTLASALRPWPFDENRRHFASNNWAVAPRRTKNGYALLAGDPHLELSLPSIWYEAHLVVPGVLDVYGVTIPGAPGIILGFNRDVAWSFTNTGADVLDFFQETVDDSVLPKQYRVDDSWKPVQREVEIIRDNRGKVIAVDTLLFTHRGPLTRRGSTWLSMRWIPLEDPLDATGFVQAAKAKSARAYLDSMARYWPAPAQNMIAADRGGSIAIRSTGRFPFRGYGGDGLTIRDGTSSANDWRGDWPIEQYPQAFDPPQGYLASANQQPLDARLKRSYLGSGDAAEVWRALRINELLRADSLVTPDAMRRYQTDPGSERADLWMPALLEAAGSRPTDRELPENGAASLGDAPSPLGKAGAVLASWDRRYTKDNHQAVLFERTLSNVTRLLWDELEDSTGSRVATPSGDVTLALLAQPRNAWWDVRATPNAIEDRNAVLARALSAAYDSLVAQLGEPSPERWRWDRVRPARISHLLRLRGFSAESVGVQGGFGTLNPSAGGGFGSSWRMVVELGPNVRAWGTYPGGQSGNPASSRYRDRIKTWSDGELDSLTVPAVAADLTNPRHTLRLRPRDN